ncbi:hypothetical protein ACHAW6_004833 [Cyclotella cf. meneghiniana]
MMTHDDSGVDTNPFAVATNDVINKQYQDNHDAVDSSSMYSTDDLIALIRAVKFAHPEMSQRNVHSEITTVVADSDPSYQFLKRVELNDVKKVWKRALKGSDSNRDDAKVISKFNEPKKNIPEVKQEEKEAPVLPPNNNGVLKFYTVGDGSVKTLAENYANHYARAAAQASTDDDDAMASKYTHFFLDVPADRSGSRPHQALINYNHYRKENKQHHNNNHNSKNRSKANKHCRGEIREIFKVQMAAAPPGMEGVSLPMLLYNEDRSAKTFLHPPLTHEDGNVEKDDNINDNDDDDDGGYFKIQIMIRNNGTSGALGQTGGQKAYFWGIVRQVEGGEGEKRRVVSLDVEELAPNQIW